MKEKQNYNTDDLREIMEILRSEDGCPWDREQDHKSIRRNLIEETYEVVEAIDKDDKTMLCEELGDLMLQVVFHARMEEEAGRFSLDDVADGICKKLILRHPHIFGDTVVANSADVLENWDKIKKVEKHQKSDYEVLDSVSHSLPSLVRADKLASKGAKLGYGFDCNISELAHKISSGESNSDEDFGMLLFAICCKAKSLNIDCEKALFDTCNEFVEQAKK